jgi:hypothetical protein
MDFALTDFQHDLRAAARRYLDDRYPPERVGELADTTGYDDGAWPELDRQGWLDPDLGTVELTLLAEEGGRTLHPVPWWSTVAYALAVYHAAGLPLPGPTAFVDGATGCRATRDGSTWRIDGTVTEVVDAAHVTGFVVAAGTPDGVALFAVDGGIRCTPREGVDPLRRGADVALDGTPARPPGRRVPGRRAPARRRVRRPGAGPLTRVPGRGRARRGSGRGAGRGRLRGVRLCPGGRTRLRDGDPGVRRHGRHMGVPAAPVVPPRPVVARAARRPVGRYRRTPPRPATQVTR